MIHTMHTVYEEYTHYIFKFRFLDPLSRTAARLLSSEFCNAADRVIAPTGKVRDLLRAYGVTKDIAVIPTGIETEKFREPLSGERRAALRQDLGIGPEEKVLLYIGRLAIEKNVDELLAGLQVCLRRRQVKLLLIGDGPDRSRLEALADRLGLGARVIFAGARPWDEIHHYYQLGDVFFSASQSETQGLTYVEALAAGLPLAVKWDRCLEGVLREGGNGYSFRDQGEMLQALEGLLADDGRRAAMARTAALTAEAFAAGQYAAKAAAVYLAAAPRAMEHVS
jgi:1,2-diacylglycerol 3-alpha-glucosyltransferase